MYGERHKQRAIKKKGTKRLKSSFVFGFFPFNNARDVVSKGVRNEPSTN